MHLIQTLDAPRPVVAPQARVRAAPRPAVEARVVVGRAATRVRRFTHQTVRRAPLREVLEDQAAKAARVAHKAKNEAVLLQKEAETLREDNERLTAENCAMHKAEPAPQAQA